MEVLTPTEFSREVLNRLLQERPDAQVQILGQSFLMVWDGTRRKVLSLAASYRRYSLAPERREALIQGLLRQAYADRRQTPSLLESRERILPQMVPLNLIEESRRDGHELAAVRYVGDLAIAFVIDSPKRYAYIHRKQMLKWQVLETDLLALAVRNLQQLSREAPPLLRIGRGPRLTLVWESFDGYDASRILLTRSLFEAAALVEGNPVIAVPHRDYMVMFGDADPAFVEEMVERTREENNTHRYPISRRFYTLQAGTLSVYTGNDQRQRIVN